MARPKFAKRSEIALYESLCLVSEEMKQASEAEEWDKIVLLGEERRVLIQGLQSGSWREKEAEDAREQKIALIQRVLSADVDTRIGVKQRMASLQNGFKTERTHLIKTYAEQAMS